MKIFLLIIISFLFHTACFPQQKTKLKGLNKPVEIIIDQWGVPHIYAKTEADLFFAQGYQAAKDRLYQFEIFRRKATGTLSEVLGKRELQRDIGARLFRYRGNLNAEYAHYHPHGKIIITAFVKGVNAYIKQVLSGEMPIPFELKLLGIKPGYWSPEVVISRHNGWLTNVQEELNTARLVQKIGEKNVHLINDYHPSNADLHIDTAIDKERLNDNILAPYDAYRSALIFAKENIATALSQTAPLKKQPEGSNNWVISGSRSASGSTMLANDPHRAITIPSLRYIVHLNAPGWNVAGGGEPTLPGVSIGHNDDGAWGLTIFETDAEDLYVYKLNPENPQQYFYKGQWRSFKTIMDTIQIKNEPPQILSLYYSVHGPVTFIDSMHHIAYAVKCGWLEKGSAPYLASLRMDQAKNWNEFKQACTYSYIPGENMVWADRSGHIGWQTVGIAPVREHHSGLVPVPGDGRFEWSGYLPVLKRPSAFDPKSGVICTANEYNTPADYPYLNSIAYSWSDAFRRDRIKEVLGSKEKISMDNMQALQTDYYAMPARALVPLLSNIQSTDTDFIKGKNMLMNWDKFLSPASVAATVYVEWEHQLNIQLAQFFKLNNISGSTIEFGIQKMINILNGKDIAAADKDQLISTALIRSVKNIKQQLGNDTTHWQYGQAKMKYVLLKHPLSSLLTDSLQSKFNTDLVARGGYDNTVNSTSGNLNQNFGASFRVLIDCSNWDLTKATNTPGQSGEVYSKHYKDLFSGWSRSEYFPLYFSKEKINSMKENILLLSPE